MTNPIRLHEVESGKTTSHPTIAAAKKAFTERNGVLPGRWWKTTGHREFTRPVWEKAEDRELFAIIWHKDDDLIEDSFGIVF